jgi:hypothetical protein
VLNVKSSLYSHKKDQEISSHSSDRYSFPCWFPPHRNGDYFNLAVFDKSGRVLVIEDLTANSAWGSWHLINGLLQKGENPMTAVKRKLFELTGYTSDNWLYMGSFMLDATQPDVNGHFFSAIDAELTKEVSFFDPGTCLFKWIAPKELKYALLDGRIGVMSYAVTASLALLLLPDTLPPPLIK